MNSITYPLDLSIKPQIIDSIKVGSTRFFVTRYGLGYAVIKERHTSRENVYDGYSKATCLAAMEELAQEEREMWGEL